MVMVAMKIMLKNLNLFEEKVKVVGVLPATNQ